MTEPTGTRRTVEILRRENFGTAKKPCWAVDVLLPNGRKLTVHDPAKPEYSDCGQREPCAKVRALYSEGAATK